jgi:hypothetical protein
MAVEATYGLMLWDGESVGTLMNVYRLVMQSKKVVVFLDPERQFFELRDESDWKKFVSRCSQQLRSRIDEEASAENELHRHSAQSDLF